VLAGAVLLESGCSTVVQEIRVDAQSIPAPLVTRIPLVVGMYYSPELRAARPVTHVEIGPGFDRYLLLGDASIVMIDTAMRGLFESVVEIRNFPPAKGELSVVGILAPSLERVRVSTDPYGICLGTYLVRYRIDLYSVAGERVATWPFEGESCDGPEPTLLAGDQTFFAEAIRFAVADLIGSFLRRPEAQAWLQANGVSSERAQ